MLSSSVYFPSENCIVEPLYGIKMKRTAKQRKQSVYNKVYIQNKELCYWWKLGYAKDRNKLIE